MTAGTDLWRALEAVRTGDPGHVAGSGYTRSTWEEHARVLAEELEAANRRNDEKAATLARVRAAAERWEAGGRAQRALEVMGKALRRHLDGANGELAEPEHAPGER